MSSASPAPKSYDFLDAGERTLADSFLEHGIVKVAVEDKAALDRIRSTIANIAASWLQQPSPKDQDAFLNGIHKHVSVDKLNEFRLAVFDGLNKESWLRAAYFATARKSLETLVGNELVMQRRINLSIQLPDDDSSLLPLHSDVWSGDSPYEVVLWLPYVDCFGTKAMYYTKADVDAQVQPNLKNFKTAEELYQAVAKDAPFIETKYGEALLFTQNIMHGNRVNTEKESRWSSNCRFKSALSPYADKKLGEFFEPITIRPATRFGLRYKLPEGFK